MLVLLPHVHLELPYLFIISIFSLIGLFEANSIMLMFSRSNFSTKVLKFILSLPNFHLITLFHTILTLHPAFYVDMAPIALR